MNDIQPSQRTYIAIDLKSFYASVECVERGLNPLDACLVVADGTRTDKTICLAVSPALKAFGVPGRPRLFEVVRIVRDVNSRRGRLGGSISAAELSSRPELAVDYIVAPPRMRLYLDYSERIRNIYLRHIAPDDIYVYSCDEVFIDATPYRLTYGLSAHDLAMRIIRDVLSQTGITATAGIGPNMYLCKVAMDIVAKKMAPDNDGVRIASLDEMTYRRMLWNHVPLTDFWRIGPGVARRLQRAGLYTMGDVARCSISHEDWFYATFGVNAELIIDHAWGWEPVQMEHVKAYRPGARSMSSGQVLPRPYDCREARNVVREMAETLALEAVEQRVVTNRVTLTVGYDAENLATESRLLRWDGDVRVDHYGRAVPRHSHGTSRIDFHTSSSLMLTSTVLALFDNIVDSRLTIRRLRIAFHDVVLEESVDTAPTSRPDLFTEPDEYRRQQCKRVETFEKERRCQEAIIALRNRFGKNAVLKGSNFAQGATQRQRNGCIGGHKA